MIMKKRIAILLLLVCILSLPSCSTSDTPNDSGTKLNVEDGSDVAEGIDVEKELFDVVLTIPAEYVGEQTQEDLDKMAEKYGFQSAVLNSDGSATYTMTKKQHQEFLDDYRQQIKDRLAELAGSESYPNFTKIEANDNFTEFMVTVKSADLNMSESFSVMTFYVYGGLYNSFSGETIDNISVTFINEATGEVISTANSKDM